MTSAQSRALWSNCRDLMGVPEALDRLGPEELRGSAQWATSSRSAASSLQLVAEPVIERHAEAHLLAREDFARQQVAEGLAQEPLAAAAAILEPHRQRRGELDHAVVEKRRRHSRPWAIEAISTLVIRSQGR